MTITVYFLPIWLSFSAARSISLSHLLLFSLSISPSFSTRFLLPFLSYSLNILNTLTTSSLVSYSQQFLSRTLSLSLLFIFFFFPITTQATPKIQLLPETLTRVYNIYFPFFLSSSVFTHKSTFLIWKNLVTPPPPPSFLSRFDCR